MSGLQTSEIPLIPLGTVLFPGIDLPLHIFEERYRQLIQDRRDVDPVFGVVLITSGSEVGDRPETVDVGTAATIEVIHGHDDGRFDLVIRGGKRFRILQREWSRPYLVATVEWLPDASDEDVRPARVEGAWRSFVALANAYLNQTTRLRGEQIAIEAREHPSGLAPAALAYVLASRLPVAPSERQELLEISSIDQFLSRLIHLMARERRLVNRIGASIIIAEGSVSKTSQ